MSDYRNKLELYVAERLKETDKSAHKTRGSGCGNEIADVSSEYFYIECKQKLTKLNIIVDYKKEWIKLLGEMPINTTKIPLIFTENKMNERFVTLNADDFFDILKRGKYGKKT